MRRWIFVALIILLPGRGRADELSAPVQASGIGMEQVAGVWRYSAAQFPRDRCSWTETGALILDLDGKGFLLNDESSVGKDQSGRPCPGATTEYRAILSPFDPEGVATLFLVSPRQSQPVPAFSLSISPDLKTIEMRGLGLWYGIEGTARRKQAS